MSMLSDIQNSIEAGQPKQAEQLIQKAVQTGTAPSDILNQAMITAMSEMGQRYKNNDIYISHILAAARAMRYGLDVLQPFIQKDEESHTLGTVILGTVEGDLHDVGKNLVAIMFRSAGFEVIDLGVDVSQKRFLKAVKEHPEASIVCVSALLTTTMPKMREIVKTLKEKDKHNRYKIMVGGGPVTQDFADEIGADVYTDNAVDAAETAKTFFI